MMASDKWRRYGNLPSFVRTLSLRSFKALARTSMLHRCVDFRPEHVSTMSSLIMMLRHHELGIVLLIFQLMINEVLRLIQEGNGHCLSTWGPSPSRAHDLVQGEVEGLLLV